MREVDFFTKQESSLIVKISSFNDNIYEVIKDRYCDDSFITNEQLAEKMNEKKFYNNVIILDRNKEIVYKTF